MKKFNQLINQIITQNRDKALVDGIFQKQGPQLVDKLNKTLKQRGYQCYFEIVGHVYYYSGYRQRLKFRPVGDNKGQSWYSIISPLQGMSTENLIYVHQSHSQICLKSDYRPQSHRGQVKHIHNSYT